MAEGPYFVHLDDVEAVPLAPGFDAQPVTGDSVMISIVTLAPGGVAAEHQHAEEQLVTVLAGELTFTLGDETKVMRVGDCAVIPPNVPHGAVAGSEGARVLDAFSPPRAGLLELMRR